MQMCHLGLEHGRLFIRQVARGSSETIADGMAYAKPRCAEEFVTLSLRSGSAINHGSRKTDVGRPTVF